MIRIYWLTTFLILLLASHKTQAQITDNKKELINILNKNARWPRELSKKKVSAVFSLRIKLSATGGITKIDASKFFPEKMKPQLTNPEIFKSINWEAVLGRKIKEGDALIIPFVVYNPMENNATFYEYTMEDLFVYPGDSVTFINCTIMQTYVMKYSEPIP